MNSRGGSVIQELTKRLVRREISAKDLVDHHIGVIEANNPNVNAVICPLYDYARKRARFLDETIAETNEPIGPLHGVPFTVKESFDVKGTPTTAGLTTLLENVAISTAPLIEHLERAGAI